MPLSRASVALVNVWVPFSQATGLPALYALLPGTFLTSRSSPLYLIQSPLFSVPFGLRSCGIWTWVCEIRMRVRFFASAARLVLDLGVAAGTVDNPTSATRRRDSRRITRQF